MSDLLDQLERQVHTAQGRERLRALLALAAELWDKNPAAAVRRAKEAAALALTLQDGGAHAQALLELGRSLSRMGQYRAALDALDEAARGHEAAGDTVGLARSWMGTGTVRSSLGQLPGALEAHFTAQTLFESQGNEWYLCACLNNIGLVYHRLDDNPASLNYALRALRMATGVGNTTVRIAATNNVGNVCMALERHEEALSYQNEALHLARVHGSPYNEIVALTNLGSLQATLSQRDGALSSLRRAGELSETSDDLENQVEIYSSLGDTHRRFGDAASALDAYEQALTLVGRMGDFYLEASVQLRRGTTLLDGGQLDPAGDALHRALTLAERLHADAIASEAHKQLCALHETRQELTGALRHLREHLRLTVALNRAAAERQSAVRVIERDLERSRQVAAAQREWLEGLQLAQAGLEHHHILGPLRAELAGQALLDPRTGLPGRRVLLPALERAFEQARRGNQPLSLAVLSLDFGAEPVPAPAAARVLQDAGRQIQQLIRGGDLLTHLDGDDLALLLPGTDAEGAERLLERLRRALAARAWPDLPGLRLTLGTTVCADTARAQAEDMLDQARQQHSAGRATGRRSAAGDLSQP
ncbi:tetratricopeptide repeat protein [Deinococcus sp. HMF7604]|uniref:tetratricopeptide repeat protein n=1 Tax=Deinococcus betulae TaxID=2873312 RepID=UPI001CCA9416|nr:tetratricopeptide repeat protein [Deinococcus betulae]MBZ9751269.1 tetratricopeptide repeat protein [Deinococcus betulae]